MLINPGGPGVSGIWALSDKGRQIQTILSSADEPAVNNSGLYFDIIAFDPRGINNTTPSSSCFPNDVTAHAWTLTNRAQAWPVSNETFNNTWSRISSLSQSCTWRLSSEDADVMEVGRFMSTPSVVEDMVAIVEALGEWKEVTAKTIAKNNPMVKLSSNTLWKRGQEKLLYWGFSYGTVIGATFAAMHPDRVGRVALDGVVDADDYYNGLWMPWAERALSGLILCQLSSLPISRTQIRS